jgi:hypothetical protein
MVATAAASAYPLLLLLAAATAKASAAGAESREAESRNPSSFLLVPNQETLDKGREETKGKIGVPHRREDDRRMGWSRRRRHRRPAVRYRRHRGDTVGTTGTGRGRNP